QEFAEKHGKDAAEVGRQHRAQVEKSLQDLAATVNDALRDRDEAYRTAFLTRLNAHIGTRWNVVAGTEGGAVIVRVMTPAEMADDTFGGRERLSSGEVRQGRMRGCHIISAIIPLLQRSGGDFEELMRTSMTVGEDGSATVRIPLGQSGTPVSISAAEIRSLE